MPDFGTPTRLQKNTSKSHPERPANAASSAAAWARPQGGRAANGKTRIKLCTGNSAPAPVRTPPGAQETSVRGVPALGRPLPADSVPAASVLPPLDAAAAAAAEEPVATTEPMSQNGLIGLLAAVSMVLVLGVSAGVIRAILS